MEPRLSCEDCKDELWTEENELSEETPGIEQKQIKLKSLCLGRELKILSTIRVTITGFLFPVEVKPFRLLSLVQATRKSLDANRIAGDREALIEAAYQKNVRFIMRAVKANPLLLSDVDDDDDDDDITRLVFKVALELREPRLFGLIHELPNKVAIAGSVDANNENLLHIAASLPYSFALNRIQEPALQMQRELQWFKEVESIISPAAREWRNRNHMKPYTLFIESHKDLVAKGEKWMKETSNSLILVSILITTATFASALSPLGGKNHDLDLLKSNFFKIFAISNTVALFASTTSLLVFLGILTSRFAEHDFLRSLPTKLMIGLLTLFLSIEATIVRLCVGLSIVFHIQSWIVIIPAVGLVHIPVTIFMWHWFLLMIKCFMFTYGPSLFDRNVKPRII